MTGAICSGCGYEYADGDAAGSQKPDERQPCPTCGSSGITFGKHLESSISLHGMLGVKAKHPNIKKPFVELKTGSNLQYKTGLWAWLVRRTDRDNNQYSEKVTDLTTNEIIHETNEPLDQHQGHGSAKNK